jgi:methionine--tRNA ligase beta chain
MNTVKKQLNTINVMRDQLNERTQRLKCNLENFYDKEIDRLKLEQESLKTQVEAELAKLKKENIQNRTDIEVVPNSVVNVNKEEVSTVKPIEKENVIKKSKPEKKPKEKKSGPAKSITATTPVDIGRLDLRVGKILNATKHANADALYVETIDVGEEKPRNVVSGLVKFVPIEAMSNRMVVLLCNLKPSKIRGILSEAMVMCAYTADNIEILEPPTGSVPGDIINVDGFTRSPDKVLKVFEEIALDLKTDDNLQATYKGIPWTVPNKGAVMAPSLKNVKIK